MFRHVQRRTSLRCCDVRSVADSLTRAQEYEAVPNAALRDACLASAAWSMALAVADVVQGAWLCVLNPVCCVQRPCCADPLSHRRESTNIVPC